MSKRERIAFVSDTIYQFNKGGKEKRLYTISHLLTNKGYDVDIYTMKWWSGNTNTIKDKKVRIFAICKYIALYNRSKRSIKQSLCFGLSCTSLLKHNYDLIDVDNVSYVTVLIVFIINLIKRKKMVITWLEAWSLKEWINYAGKLGIIAFLLEKVVSKLPAKHVSISDHTTRMINTLFNKRGVHTIPVGVNKPPINHKNTQGKTYDIVYFGRLAKHKNLKLLFDAIKILKQNNFPTRCLIIGDGTEKTLLKKYVSTLNLNKEIQFQSFINNEKKLYKKIASAKVFVLPSEREGFGMSVIEANACGIPAIVTNSNSNAAKNLIKSGVNGFICKNNPKDLSKTIIKTLAAEISPQSCVSAIEKFSWSSAVKKLTSVYSS